MDLPGASGAQPRADAVDRVARSALLDLAGDPDVRRVGIALAEGGGRRLHFLASDSTEWCHIDAYDDVPLTTVVRTGRPILGGLDALDPRFAGIVERQRAAGVAALAALPLVDAGGPLGGVVLFFERAQPFDDEQRRGLAARLATYAAALRAARAAPEPVAPLPGDGTPEPDGALVARVAVADDPRAVGMARRFVRERLGEWEVPDEVVDTAVLCVSELVTNVVMHAASTSEVDARLVGEVLTVRVRDHGGRSPGSAVVPRDEPARVDPFEVHGRGLRLVEALTSGCGSELDDQGTTMWFTLSIAG